MICDDPGCWPDHAFDLERCAYGAFVASAVSGRARAEWLSRQHPRMLGAAFNPQPWEQCAKVLREMGHAEDARFVLIEKERRQREARRDRLRARGRIGVADVLAVRDWILGVTVHFGHRPLHALWSLALVWLIGTIVFFAASDLNAVKPNSTFVLRSPEWVACAPGYRPFDDRLQNAVRNDGRSQLACYLDQPEAQGYPVFNAGLYSLDTLLPIVSLEMQDYWIPDETQVPEGTLARWYLWLHIGAGWALSLLAVAGFSGLVKSD